MDFFVKNNTHIIIIVSREFFNEGNPPEAIDDLENYIIDHAANYNLQLKEIIRPPNTDYYTEILDWCKEPSFEGGGILVFRRS